LWDILTLDDEDTTLPGNVEIWLPIDTILSQENKTLKNDKTGGM
jgi:hypothetical protein